MGVRVLDADRVHRHHVRRREPQDDELARRPRVIEGIFERGDLKPVHGPLARPHRQGIVSGHDVPAVRAEGHLAVRRAERIDAVAALDDDEPLEDVSGRCRVGLRDVQGRCRLIAVFGNLRVVPPRPKTQGCLAVGLSCAKERTSGRSRDRRIVRRRRERELAARHRHGGNRIVMLVPDRRHEVGSVFGRCRKGGGIAHVEMVERIGRRRRCRRLDACAESDPALLHVDRDRTGRRSPDATQIKTPLASLDDSGFRRQLVDLHHLAFGNGHLARIGNGEVVEIGGLAFFRREPLPHEVGVDALTLGIGQFPVVEPDELGNHYASDVRFVAVTGERADHRFVCHGIAGL